MGKREGLRMGMKWMGLTVDGGSRGEDGGV